jgi:hypothetical protein
MKKHEGKAHASDSDAIHADISEDVDLPPGKGGEHARREGLAANQKLAQQHRGYYIDICMFL